MGAAERDINDAVRIQLLQDDGTRVAHKENDTRYLDAARGRTGTSSDDHE